MSDDLITVEFTFEDLDTLFDKLLAKTRVLSEKEVNILLGAVAREMDIMRTEAKKTRRSLT